MSYSLDYLPFQMCPRFEFAVRRTNTSNQRHTRLSQHPAAFDSVQHLVLSLCCFHKWTFLPSLPCDSTWSTGREIIEALTMMGLSQRRRDSVSSVLCCCVFLNYHPFKRITSAPKVVCNTVLLFFPHLWQTGLIPQISEAWSPQQGNRSPQGSLVTHSYMSS